MKCKEEERMSKNYEKVKGYYEKGFWTIEMVQNAIGKWITEDEYVVITGKQLEELA